MSKLSLDIPMTVGANLTVNVQLAAGVKVQWNRCHLVMLLKGCQSDWLRDLTEKYRLRCRRW